MADLQPGSWFMEKGPMWQGQAFSLEVDKVLMHKKSQFQDIVVFQSKTWGKVLVLDGVIQVTEKDEFSYQEMIAHLPLCAHPNPERVLVIGGGDGGVIREVARHKEVKEMVLCEIDGDVIAAGREYFPQMSCKLDDPRCKVVVADGNEYLKDKEGYFDVIIVDSSDPVGPAEVLFQSPFFRSLKRTLRPNGIVCTQAECMWLHLDIIKSVLADCRAIFNTVEYAYVNTPTYPCGNIGFMVCSLAGSSKEPLREPSDTAGLRYYSKAVHKSAFVLPRFADEVVNADS
eukprot:tig00000581_g2240.t1